MKQHMKLERQLDILGIINIWDLKYRHRCSGMKFITNCTSDGTSKDTCNNNYGKALKERNTIIFEKKDFNQKPSIAIKIKLCRPT